MQFESAAAERMFLESFHTQRATQDRIFAVTQAAIALLLALRIPSNAIPAVRLLFWGTHAISATVLGLSSADKASYARLRPYLLSAARVFYNLLCPQLVWQLAAQSSAQGGSRDSWPAFFLLWVTWSRWGSQLLTQVGYLLPFNIEAVLTPFGALLDMLNNQRLCRLLTVVQAQQRPFYRTAFAWLATRLAVPFEMFFATAPRDGCLSADWSAGSGGDTGSSAGSDLAGSACAWNLCTAAVASGRGGGGDGGGGLAVAANGLQQAADEVAACYCESVFSMSQLLLTLVLPLAAVGYAEARQRWLYAAGAQSTLRQQQQHQQRQQRQSPLHRLRHGPEEGAGWSLCFGAMRLYALLALVQLRVFLSLRFGMWQPHTWACSSCTPHTQAADTSWLPTASASGSADHGEL
ncbi:hypothetical protein ACK3TF_003416 [Chlorella vulgaris]